MLYKVTLLVDTFERNPTSKDLILHIRRAINRNTPYGVALYEVREAGQTDLAVE